MNTAEQTEAIQFLHRLRFRVALNFFRSMADVCEALCLFSVFCGLS